MTKLKYIFKKEVYSNTQYAYYLGFSILRMKFVLYRTIVSYVISSDIMYEFVIFSSFNAAKMHMLTNYDVKL